METPKGKRLLFSVTLKDLEMETFCTGGNGGQHRNAKQNGVRLTHRASGAVAEHRDGRDQGKNRIEAFRKLAETPAFKKWHKAEVSRWLGKEALAEEEVERAMSPRNIKTEVRNEKGLWAPAEEMV